MKLLRHYPFSLEPVEQDCEVLSGFGSPAEFIALSFTALSEVDLQDVRISAGDLKCGASKIGASEIDVYVVHQWDQSGIGICQGDRVKVPELLLKNDGESLQDGHKRLIRNWRHLFNVRRIYDPPRVRLQGPVETTLQARTGKQIWVSVRVPKDISPGTYVGHVSIHSANASCKLPLEIAVLPIKLAPADQDLFIFYKGSLDWWNEQHYVSADNMRRQFQDIFDHGFNSICINERRTKFAQKAIDIAFEVGFRQKILLLRPFPELNRLNFRGLSPVCHISDEVDLHTKIAALPDINDDPHVKEHRKLWKEAREGQMPSMSTIYHESFTRRFLDESDLGCAPDTVAYCLIPNKDYFYFRSNFDELSSNLKVLYYWPAHMEKPSLHRVLAGCYMWKSKVQGIVPYCYQHLPMQPYSPFNDFDPWEPLSKLEELDGVFRDHMLTYPAQDGVIPTIQWEGFREGITDLRYLTTLNRLIEAATRTPALAGSAVLEEVCQFVDEFLRKIDLRKIQIHSKVEREPYADIFPEEYQAFRRGIAERILLLQNVLRTEIANQEGHQPQ